VCGIHQALGGGELAFGVDDLRTLLAFRLGLLGHSPQHGLGHIHLLTSTFATSRPRARCAYRDTLQTQVNLVACASNSSSFLLAEHRARVVCANCEV